MDFLDVSLYVTPTRFSGLSGVFLARAILEAAPKKPSKRVRAALVGVRQSAEALRAASRERMRHVPRNIRPLDAALDAGWVGLREAIESKSRLTGSANADRAATLLATLFPDGTSFVRAEYREQWAASHLHLERIDEEDLADEIEAIAGADFLPYIRDAHAAFGDALGLGAERPEAVATSAIATASSELAYAIAEYGRLLAGELERDDAANVAAFRRAMAPLDEHRRASSRARGRSTSEEPAPEPEPEVNLDEPMPVVEG